MTSAHLREIFGIPVAEANQELIKLLPYNDELIQGCCPTNIMSPKITTDGYLEERWMPPEFPSWSISKLDMIAPGIVRKSAHYVNNEGLAVVEYLNSLKSPCSKKSNDSYLVKKALHSIARWFFLDFSNNKCLSFSLALRLLLHKLNIDSRLIIGVRTQPFLSHAWVEINGTILNDSSDLRQRLTVISEA